MVDNREYGLVLAGGGTKGAYQVGVWKALKELNINVKGIVGASIGSLNGALFLQDDFKMVEDMYENIKLGKAEVLKKIIDGEKSNKTKILQKIGDKVFNNKIQRERVTIIAIGKMVARAMDIGQRLQEKMDVEVINARFLKPLDDNTIIESIKKTKNVITIEDGTIINGLATAVKEVIVNNNLQGVKIKSYAYPDEFIKHGSVDELEKIYGLDEENIINGVNKS